MLLTILCLLCVATCFSQAKKGKTRYAILQGFIYYPDNVPEALPYEGGPWALYFFLEHTVPVRPEIRRFLQGEQRALFRVEFDSLGKLEGVFREERYFWYTIDEMARPLVDDFIKALTIAEGWKSNFSGTLWIPLLFRCQTGRVRINYDFFVYSTVRTVVIGQK